MSIKPEDLKEHQALPQNQRLLDKALLKRWQHVGDGSRICVRCGWHLYWHTKRGRVRWRELVSTLVGDTMPCKRHIQEDSLLEAVWKATR